MFLRNRKREAEPIWGYFMSHAMPPGWLHRWVCEKVFQDVAQPFFAKNNTYISVSFKNMPQNMGYFCKVNNHPLGEISPILVTLHATHACVQLQMFWASPLVDLYCNPSKSIKRDLEGLVKWLIPKLLPKAVVVREEFLATADQSLSGARRQEELLKKSANV
jgi:hypothetical protein